MDVLDIYLQLSNENTVRVMMDNQQFRFCCLECGSQNIKLIETRELLDDPSSNPDIFNQLYEQDTFSNLLIEKQTKNNNLVNKIICEDCHTIYPLINDIPCFLSKEDKESELFSRYFKNYKIIAQDDITEDIMPVGYKEIQADKLIKYCGSKITQKVLDVGSGKGYFLERVPHKDKMGVDIAIEYLEILRNKDINCILSNAENLPFNEEFDLIVLNDILEHVCNPDKVMESTYKALKPGGMAFIRVPYKEDISVYSPEKGCKYEFVHLRSFDEETLLKIVSESLFTFKQFHYDGFFYSRLREKGQNFLVDKALRRVKDYYKQEVEKGKSYIDVDLFFNRLPNFLGCLFFKPQKLPIILEKLRLPQNFLGNLFFEPMEIVLVLEKSQKHI